MRLAHLADWHLGRRQFERRTPGGMNQREADVYDALARTVDDLLEVRPEVIVVAGDIFDSPRPPNTAVVFLFGQLQRLRAGLPDTKIVLISGNHDQGRTIETASILPLYRALGVAVVMGRVERVAVPGGVVTCVPHLVTPVAYSPGTDGLQILVAHAAVGYGDGPAVAFEGWDYVALGDYHVCHQVGPRAWYAGSLEWTSSDPWSEVRERPDKGYLLMTVGHEPNFRPIQTRRFVDLPPLDACGFSPAQLDAALAEVLHGDLAGAIVRLVIENVPRGLDRELDWKALRLFKAEAFHLQLDFRRPEHQAVTPEGRAIRRKRLDEVVDEFFAGRALPADVDRDALRAHAREYMTEPETKDA